MTTHVARLLTAFIVLLGSTAGWALGPAHAAETPVTVTGSVIDADTDAGVADAHVDAVGPDSMVTTTDAGGSYSLSLTPGWYDFYASSFGFDGGYVGFEVTAETTIIPPIELTPATPGIHVFVDNASWGGAAAEATVRLEPGSGAPVDLVTDGAGQALFDQLDAGDYTVQVLPGNDYLGSEPETVQYEGGVHHVHLTAEMDLRCEPAAPNTGLTNMGFENNLDDWTLGLQTESVQAVGADDFTTPWEGSTMARLGLSRPTSDELQSRGPNILCQDFVVDQAQETFAFNVFTYDYTGFDEFQFDVVVTAPVTGETLAAYRQEAWGDSGDTTLKTSGWRGVTLDLADHVGETVRLTFRSGGTQDELFAFWAYLDSATTLPPTVETPASDVQTTTGSVTNDPVTGQVTVSMPSGETSDVTLNVPAECQTEGVAPSSVSVFLNAAPFLASPAGDGLYTVTIPQSEITSGTLSVEIVCDGETTLVTPIGKIVLYDPSGTVSDAVTGAPVVGAEVTLYKVPGWTPQGEAGPYPENSCQSNLSKDEGAPWSQPAPTDLGQLVNAASPEISPNVNPFVTNSVGYYGWDVAEGCWYVVVEAEGFQTLTSPVVGVPPEVTDLDLALEPIAGAGGGGGGTAEPPNDTTDPTPIENTEEPVISGTPKVGSTLTATTGSWDTTGLSYTYQWLRNGVPIVGATSATYALTPADAAKSLTVRVTASQAGHVTGVAVSEPMKVAHIATTVKLKVPKKVPVGTKLKGVVTVKAAAGGPPNGKVVLKAGKKRIGVATLEAGKTKITSKKFKKLKPGKYKLVVVYKGSTRYAKSSSKKMTVRAIR